MAERPSANTIKHKVAVRILIEYLHSKQCIFSHFSTLNNTQISKLYMTIKMNFSIWKKFNTLDVCLCCQMPNTRLLWIDIQTEHGDSRDYKQRRQE